MEGASTIATADSKGTNDSERRETISSPNNERKEIPKMEIKQNIKNNNNLPNNDNDDDDDNRTQNIDLTTQSSNSKSDETDPEIPRVEATNI